MYKYVSPIVCVCACVRVCVRACVWQFYPLCEVWLCTMSTYTNDVVCYVVHVVLCTWIAVSLSVHDDVTGFHLD